MTLNCSRGQKKSQKNRAPPIFLKFQGIFEWKIIGSLCQQICPPEVVGSMDYKKCSKGLVYLGQYCTKVLNANFEYSSTKYGLSSYRSFIRVFSEQFDDIFRNWLSFPVFDISETTYSASIKICMKLWKHDFIWTTKSITCQKIYFFWIKTSQAFQWNRHNSCFIATSTVICQKLEQIFFADIVFFT